MTSYQQILTINCGSSSLKFSLYRLDVDVSSDEPESLVFTGAAERIGGPGGLFHVADGSQRQLVREDMPFAHQEEALQHILSWLEAHSPAHPDGVGHRIVHG